MTLIRTEPFVPLTSATPTSPGERMDFQATVISQPSQTKKIQSSEAGAPGSASSVTSPRVSTCEPCVTVQREGDHVAGIRVQCSCGQVVDLACVYQPDTIVAKA